MKCPKCKYVSFEYLDSCKKCGRDLTKYKIELDIHAPQTIPIDIMAYKQQQEVLDEIKDKESDSETTAIEGEEPTETISEPEKVANAMTAKEIADEINIEENDIDLIDLEDASQDQGKDDTDELKTEKEDTEAIELVDTIMEKPSPPPISNGEVEIEGMLELESSSETSLVKDEVSEDVTLEEEEIEALEIADEEFVTPDSDDTLEKNTTAELETSETENLITQEESIELESPLDIEKDDEEENNDDDLLDINEIDLDE